MLGIWTRGSRMEGADKSIELRRHPIDHFIAGLSKHEIGRERESFWFIILFMISSLSLPLSIYLYLSLLCNTWNGRASTSASFFRAQQKLFPLFIFTRGPTSSVPFWLSKFSPSSGWPVWPDKNRQMSIKVAPKWFQ